MEYEKFIQQHIASTAESYRHRLASLDKFSEGRRITGKLISDWCLDLKQRGMSANTIKAHYQTAKAYLKWSGRDIEVPKPILPPPGKGREAMTEEEYNLLKRDVPNTEWGLLIRLAWETGLRLGDICLLLVHQVKTGDTGTFIQAVPCKTKRFGKAVEIPISEELGELMRTAANSHPPDGSRLSGYIFPSLATLYLTDQHKTISAIFHRIAQKAGVNKSFHSFRHAFVTRHLERGVNPAILATITGQSIKVLMSYCHPSLEAKRKALGV